MMDRIVLASASPRRKELLTQLGVPFQVLVTQVEEQRQQGETAHDYVLRLSQDKARAGVAMAAEQIDQPIVIGADTIVVQGDSVLEKPVDQADAKRMLLALSGTVHQVMTAVTVATQQTQQSTVVITDVWFKPLTDQEIEQYWQTGEPYDKAGGYGIQGVGGKFVTRIEGSFSAVVGLPLFETDQLLRKFL